MAPGFHRGTKPRPTSGKPGTHGENILASVCPLDLADRSGALPRASGVDFLGSRRTASSSAIDTERSTFGFAVVHFAVNRTLIVRAVVFVVVFVREDSDQEVVQVVCPHGQEPFEL